MLKLTVEKCHLKLNSNRIFYSNLDFVVTFCNLLHVASSAATSTTELRRNNADGTNSGTFSSNNIAFRGQYRLHVIQFKLNVLLVFFSSFSNTILNRSLLVWNSSRANEIYKYTLFYFISSFCFRVVKLLKYCGIKI